MSPSTPDSGAEFELKHRILGAVILITAAVVFLPLVLNETPTPQAPLSKPGSSPEPVRKKVFVSKITPISGNTPTVAAPIKSSRDKTKKKVIPTPPSPTAKSIKKTGKSSKPAASNAEIDRGWIVQIGIFSKKENSKRVIGLLKTKGFKVRTTGVKTETGRATRVWIGPYVQRVDAARERARIEKSTGQEGYITAYP